MRHLIQKGFTALTLSLFLFMGSCFTAHAQVNFPYGNKDVVTQPGTGLAEGLNRLEQNIDQKETGIIKEDSLKELVNGWTSFFLQFYMFLAVGLLIYFGVRLIVSQGAEDERKKLIQAIINLAIGTLVIFLSYVIVNQVVSLIDPSGQAQNTGVAAQGVNGVQQGAAAITR